MVLERHPAVAGLFYPGRASRLSAAVEGMDNPEWEPKYTGILGIVVPHAGYVYSGKTAMRGYSELRNVGSRNFVLIGPNHNSRPYYSAVYPDGVWETPLGKVSVNGKLARKLLDAGQQFVSDPYAHSEEHSLEVQLPFLQYLFADDFTITPIVMGNQEREESVAIARALREIDEEFTLIISSDLTHYESLDSANRKDDLLISSALSLDVEKYYHTVMLNNISACGYGPIAVLMEYTKLMGGTMELLDHTTSYDYSRDPRNVVGYCSLISHKQ